MHPVLNSASWSLEHLQSPYRPFTLYNLPDLCRHFVTAISMPQLVTKFSLEIFIIPCHVLHSFKTAITGCYALKFKIWIF